MAASVGGRLPVRAAWSACRFRNRLEASEAVDSADAFALLVVWDQRDSFTGEDQPPVPFDRPWPADGATAVDAFGHTHPAELRDGRLRLDVSVTPLFVTAS